MSDRNEILNSEEVEFLLESSGANAEQAPPQSNAAQVATMRGDLEQMPLADIFQTIGMTKMEGVLRVANPVEQRLVWFRDGIVRIVVPPRAATRRLGHRLVQAGLLDPEQLRLALLEQRKQRRPLGELLVTGGYVTAEQIEEIVTVQITEELFSLFTWEHGDFEFFKGPPQDESLKERLAECPQFEVNSLLLEVARRSDEWESILAALRSLDEVPVRASDAEPPADLGEFHRAVLLAIDGRHTYRELADAAVQSVFECARAARDLMRQQLLQVATDEHLLEVAKHHLEHGHGRLAVMLAHTLRTRDGTRPVGVLRELATVLKRANEQKLACNVLLEAAQLQTDGHLAMELATEALALSPHDLAAQGFLRTTMLAHKRPDAPELETVTLALLDGLVLEDELERVAAIAEETRQLGCYTPAIMVREARALAKKKDRDGAILLLTKAAEAWAQKGDKQRQIETLDLALRLDRDRKDLQKQLRALKSTPKRRALEYGGVAAAALLLLSLGAVWWSGRLHSDRALAAATELGALLAANQVAAATTALATWEERLGQCTEIEDLRRQLEFARANEKQRLHKVALRTAATRLQQAAEAMARGSVRDAFAIYEDLQREPQLAAMAAEAARARTDGLVRDLDEAGKRLSGALPAEPDDLIEQQQIDDCLTLLRQQVPVLLRSAARKLLDEHRHGGLPTALSAEQRTALVQAAERAVGLLDRGARLIELYEAASTRSAEQRRLDPLFQQALESEQQLRFDAALTAYRQLAAANAGARRVRAHFADKVTELEGIVRALGAIDAATKAADFATADREYRALCEQQPQVPFARIVQLPVTVRASMPGAQLRWNGADAGETPQKLTYAPGARCAAELRLDRFADVSAELPPDHDGTLEILLTLQASATVELPGAIDQTITIDQTGRAFAVDGTGNILCLTLADGRLAWQHPTDDTAGFLSSPQLHRDQVLVASLDGPLRALHQATGKVLWQANAPTEYDPAVGAGRVAVATTDGRCAMFDIATGESLGQMALPGDAAGAPIAQGAIWLVPLADGTAVAVDSRSGDQLWRSQPGELGSLLVPTDRGTLTIRDDGSLALIATPTGQPIWEQALANTPTGRPTVRGSRALLTFDERTVVLDLDSGKELWASPRPPEGFAGNSRFIGDFVAVPTRDGTVLVYGLDRPTPRYRLAGERKPALGARSGDWLAVASGRTLRVYRQLP